MTSKIMTMESSQNMILMGVLFFRFVPGGGADHYLIESENRIDIQQGYQCSAFSGAYLLRHFQIEAAGEDLYKKNCYDPGAGGQELAALCSGGRI